ncbi:MAG TPA: GntR family transcriptional regulator [Gemmatimonadaceae bacterium]|nr:GntR family transcriptional regulator [Gemmatimonadaceae bacterium]
MTAPTDRRPRADVVYDALLDQLTDGSLPPGVPLSINALARDFAVSPTPVREALSRLALSGLVTRVPPRGYQTTPLMEPVDIQRLGEARLLIEASLVELAVQRNRPRVVADLEACLAEQRREGDSASRHRRTGEEFHRILATAADNRFLLESYTVLGGHIERFRVQSATGSYDHIAAVAEHEAILDAVRRGDARGAGDAMRRHLELADARTLRALDRVLSPETSETRGG